jgi:Leucine-rich repeat (LRR) protein
MLRSLYCDNNPIISLDITKNVHLELLSCGHNNLFSLKVSYNAKLVWLFCPGNNLEELDISRNILIDRLFIGEMNSLGKVCVWELPFPPAGMMFDSMGSPNIYFTTDCNIIK